jgi:hypothetical protein
MSAADKIKNAAQDLIGKATEAAGKVTDNERLQAQREGEGEQKVMLGCRDRHQREQAGVPRLPAKPFKVGTVCIGLKHQQLIQCAGNNPRMADQHGMKNCSVRSSSESPPAADHYRECAIPTRNCPITVVAVKRRPHRSPQRRRTP